MFCAGFAGFCVFDALGDLLGLVFGFGFATAGVGLIRLDLFLFVRLAWFCWV